MALSVGTVDLILSVILKLKKSSKEVMPMKSFKEKYQLVTSSLIFKVILLILSLGVLPLANV